MNDFSRRIAALSPKQLKLLKLRLKKEGIDLDRDIKIVETNPYPPISPVEKKEYYPLSSVQKRMFTIHQMEGIGTTYVISINRIIRENLDKNRVQEVFKNLIKRHESFRTSFEFINGEPVQRIHHDVDFEIEYYDSGRQGDRETGNKRTPASLPPSLPEFLKAFDLSRPPLLRAGLIKLAEKKYNLIINLHHIISDAVSNKIIWNEFNRLHSRLPLEELNIQYKDFSQWQNSGAVKSALDRQKKYWLKQYNGEIPVINLPADFPRPLNKSYEGGYHIFKINTQETSALKALTLKENTTLFVIMLAIYNVFLEKITRQKDIIVGVPIAGRRQQGLHNTVGMFVNTLALRNYPEEENTFADFLKGLRKRTLEAFENQDYQFEDLVNEVVKQRDPSRNPIFDVFFSFRAPGVSQEMPENLEEEETNTQGTLLSYFDLYFLGAEIKEEMYLVLIYSAKLFKKETISRFVGYIKEIISSTAANNNIKLKDIKISHDLGFAKSTVFHDEESDFGF